MSIPPYRHNHCHATSFTVEQCGFPSEESHPRPLCEDCGSGPAFSGVFFSIHRDVTASHCPRGGAGHGSSQQNHLLKSLTAVGIPLPQLPQVPGYTLFSWPQASPGPPSHPTERIQPCQLSWVMPPASGTHTRELMAPSDRCTTLRGTSLPRRAVLVSRYLG